LTAPRFEDMVAIGVVIKPQGRKGEVAVEPLTDRPERFPSLRQAWLPDGAGGARRIDVEGCWPHKGRYVIKVKGVDSIEEAERLRGQELRIGEDELEALPAGSYYHHQLRGLRVEAGGRELGRVDDILETGAGAPVLVVRGPRGETLIPLAEGFVERVDLAGGLLVARGLDPVEVP
jgi:16S rRNA processing protein RimM